MACAERVGHRLDLSGLTRSLLTHNNVQDSKVD